MHQRPSKSARGFLVYSHEGPKPKSQTARNKA
jgi:hypothetical protein